MPSFVVDGMTVEAVHEAIADACKHVRAGKGPVLLDIRTYRYKGHSMSDPQKYRTKGEVEEYKNSDPISKVLTTIKEEAFASEEEIKAIQQRVKDTVAESVKFAEDSPEPEAHELYEDVYMEEYPFVKEYK